mmetsp:Transcript_47804/g.63159  ORF Transcript_47804/g.63159 Transcript_47804/m.63159 type:complete len:124 (+) Transcript_47804:1176-1547(+)
MLATTTFLGLNQIASGSVMYDGMTLKELAENAYSELLAHAESVKADDFPEVPLKLKEKLGLLMSTKEMNPALYISPLFLFGVYMPVFAPFLVPILLTLTGILKLKFAEKIKSEEKKEEKEKTE